MNDVYAIELLRSVRAEVALPDNEAVATARDKFVSELRATPASPARRPKRSRTQRMPRSARAIVIMILIIAALVGTAVATISHFAGPIATVDESKNLGALTEVTALEIFQTPSQVDFATSPDRAKIDKTAAGSGGDSLAAKIDPATARSVPIPGVDAQLWLIATPSNKLCIFTPANSGFNSACGGPAVISKTGMISVPSGADEASRLAVSVAPNGVTGLTVTSIDGIVRKVAPYKGVAVAHVEATDSVSNGVVTLNIAKMPGPGAQAPQMPPKER